MVACIKTSFSFDTAHYSLLLYDAQVKPKRASLYYGKFHPNAEVANFNPFYTQNRNAVL